MAIRLGLNSAAKLHRSDKHPPGGAAHAGFTGFRGLRGFDGKGMIGCIIFLVLIGTAIFLAIRLGPIYYSNHNFESDVETVVDLGAAQSLCDSNIVESILGMAKRNKISLEREDIQVDRFAGQVHIKLNYSVPVSYALFNSDINFHIEASSFVGPQQGPCRNVSVEE